MISVSLASLRGPYPPRRRHGLAQFLDWPLVGSLRALPRPWVLGSSPGRNLLTIHPVGMGEVEKGPLLVRGETEAK